MRYLKVSYMEQDPQDVEHMVLALRNHFSQIQEMNLTKLMKKNHKSMGAQELIAISNAELKKLRHNLDQF